MIWGYYATSTPVDARQKLHKDDPFFSQFLSYWKKLASDADGVPTRRQFCPWEITKDLPNIFMINRNLDGTFSVRLTGSALDFAGDEHFQPGNDIEQFDEKGRAAYGAYFDALFEGRCACWNERIYITATGAALQAEAVSVPLFDDNKNVQIALGKMRLTALKKQQDIEVKGYDYSHLHCLDYFDVGYGVPEGLWTYHAKST